MKISQPIAGFCLAALLNACGGSGSSAPAATGPSAEGVYGGTMTGGASSAFQMLVLENGEYWMMYGNQSAILLGVTGFIQGTGPSNNGSFTSSNAKDFGFTPALGGTVAATYDATARTVSGTATSGANSATFVGGPISGSLYNYTIAPSLTTIAGTWLAVSLTGEGVAIDISTNGVFAAASTSGCKFAGLITPRPSGKNVFNAAMQFGAAPCALPGQSATGIAIAYPLANGKTQLIVAATDSTRALGYGVVGIR